jgi:hypothetical protein
MSYYPSNAARGTSPTPAGLPARKADEMLMYYFTPDSNGTTLRFWLWGMETLSESMAQELGHLQEVLNKVSCWNGPDKIEHKGFAATMLSWEFPRETAEGTAVVIKAFLRRLLGVKIEEAFRY